MKTIELTRGYVALVDEQDYERVNQYKWRARLARRKDGGIHNVYALRGTPKANGKQATQHMHRFILGVTDPNIEVDHEDHNGLNNQRYNLRKATHAENMRNLRLSIVNTSGIKGVYWDKTKSKWRARIACESKRKSLGYFTALEEATSAYDAAAILYHKEFACTNEMLTAA